MKHITSNAKTMWSLLEREFTIDMIAEKLWSAADTEETEKVAKYMGDHAFDVAGVKTDKGVTCWIDRKDLMQGKRIAECMQTIDLQKVIAAATPLWVCLDDLAHQDWLFTMTHREVSGIVTTADLNKQPARLLMFGLISFMEMTLKKLIRHYRSEDRWQALTDPKSLKTAKSLFKKKMDLNQETDLLDCLQIADVIRISLQMKELNDFLEMEDEDPELFIENLRELRNYLAHSQENINSWDWHSKIVLLGKIESIIKNLVKHIKNV